MVRCDPWTFGNPYLYVTPVRQRCVAGRYDHRPAPATATANANATATRAGAAGAAGAEVVVVLELVKALHLLLLRRPLLL